LPRHDLPGGQLHHGRAATDLRHRTLIDVFERFRRFALHQTFDRFADMIASLEGVAPRRGSDLPVSPSVMTAMSPMAKTPG